jgi:DNA-directed RNA polymerase subunit beta'
LKAVDLLVNEILPEDIRGDYDYDKAGMSKLTAVIASRHPDKYQDIIQKISDIGRNHAYTRGTTITLQDLKPVIDKDIILKDLDSRIKDIRVNSKTREERQRKTLETYAEYSELIDKATLDASLKKNNNLGKFVGSGARGKPAQLKAMLSTPALYTDYKDAPIKLFVKNSFGEGLVPAEYMASTFGARKGVISTKNATAQAGDLGKLLSQVSAPVTVSEDDCHTTSGIKLDLDDKSLTGRVLSNPIGGLKPGTIIDRDTINILRKKGVNSIVTRSPITCGSHTGVCSKCLGADSKGTFKDIGYAAGVISASSVMEPLAQEGLNTKHLGGIAKSGKKSFSGFKYLSQFVQVPDKFPDRAAVSEATGKVSRIEDAPQGGKFVYVDDQEHYVNPGFDILVKQGQKVEKGQQLSDGLVNPADIVRLRGLGEGRKYYAQRMKKILDDSGLDTDSRHAEVIARAAVNHIAIGDHDRQGNLPDDVIEYNGYAHNYSPPKSAVELKPGMQGYFLETPVLHYSIGTELTPSIIEDIQSVKPTGVLVSNEPPQFRPEMVRLRNAPQRTKSWIQRMSTSYLKGNLQDAAIQGLESDTTSSPYYADTLAKGVDFGKNIETTGKF